MSVDRFKDEMSHMRWLIRHGYDIKEYDLDLLEKYFNEVMEEERSMGDET